MLMTLRKLAQSICALTLFTACLFGQTVSSSLVGTVQDPTNAVVPNAPITLTDMDTGSVRSASTDSSVVFRFLNITPGTYSLSVKVTGFKGLTQNQIVVQANETRDMGKLTLDLGNTTDTVSVTAEAAAIQLATSEKSAAIEGKQLSDVTLRAPTRRAAPWRWSRPTR